MFGLYKSQIDADFNLYKNQRDNYDILAKELSDLKAHVAVNDAVRPYQDKLIQCEITVTGLLSNNPCCCRQITTSSTTPAA